MHTLWFPSDRFLSLCILNFTKSLNERGDGEMWGRGRNDDSEKSEPKEWRGGVREIKGGRMGRV